MDRIEKFLQQLSKKERLMLQLILVDIRLLVLKKYDVKPLRGYKGIFRLKKGSIRVVFAKVSG